MNRYAFIFIVGMLLLTGCGNPPISQAGSIQLSQSATEQASSSVNTSTASPSITPTVTPTETLIPTSTSTPTSTPKPTKTPTITPTPLGGGGGQIAFVHAGYDYGAIFVVNPDGKELKLLVNHYATWLQWINEGRNLIFRSTGPPESKGFCSIGSDGSNEQCKSDTELKLNDSYYGNDFDTELLPDGNWILISENYWDISKLNIVTGEKIKLAVGDGFSWSPDGKKIAFTSPGPPDLYFINADGSDETQIYTRGYPGDPVWSPDGQKLAFFCYMDSRNICLSNSDGTEQIILVGNKERYINYLAWSPDSKKIAYLIGYRITTLTAWADIYIVDVETKKVTKLTNKAGAVPGEPQWSPDGTMLAFIGDPDEDDIADLFVVQSDGTDPHPITKDININDFTW